MSGIIFGVGAVIALIEIIGLWRVFSKAGRPGWGAIIPIYNSVLLCNIAGLSGWLVILFFIPLVNIVIAIIVLHGVSKAFGHGFGFTLGLLFLGFIFVPVLGFGRSKYQTTTTVSLPGL
jgi:hypothetical protein